MSELFDLEMQGVPKKNMDLLPKDRKFHNEEKNKIGYTLGQDYSYFKVSLPQECDEAIKTGFEENKQHTRDLQSDRFIKKWLQLRHHAYLRERTVAEEVTPSFIKAIDLPECRITKKKLTHGLQEDCDWSIERLCNNAGYAWGNLVVVSKLANEIRGSMTYQQISAAAENLDGVKGLTQQEWIRYKNLARGPNFWAGEVKGIEPLSWPVSDLIFMAPSQLLQYVSFKSVLDRLNGKRDIGLIILKKICPRESSVVKLKKLQHKIERHLKKNHFVDHIFTNKSCFESFLEWYQSSNFSYKEYVGYMNGVRLVRLNLPRKDPSILSPLDEWWLSTKGYIY